MKRIYLIRHGQSRSQTGEDKDGVDPELSVLGMQQARRLSDPLNNIKIDRILISPLRRAQHTYQLSQANARRAEFDSRVIESNWGIPGYYKKILPVVTPDIAEPDRHDAWLKDVKERCEELLSELLSCAEENILLFGHWGLFSTFFLAFTQWTDISDRQVRLVASMDNAAISLFEVDDNSNRIIRYWNDRSHVMDLL
jgi:broad specificity phosphatase PhoE